MIRHRAWRAMAVGAVFTTLAFGGWAGGPGIRDIPGVPGIPGVLAGVRAASAAPLEAQTLEQRSRAIGLKLRCPICQNVSVAESTSELAAQMRQVIRDQLQEGKTEQEIVAYFVERYGESVIFDPPKQGFSLVVWVVTPLGVLGGALMVWRTLRRRGQRTGQRPAQTTPAQAAAALPPAELAPYLARVRTAVGQPSFTAPQPASGHDGRSGRIMVPHPGATGGLGG